jgi:hypothetical protein
MTVSPSCYYETAFMKLISVYTINLFCQIFSVPKPAKKFPSGNISIDLNVFFRDYIVNMQTSFLSRSFLETLSSSDLISLADDYGIDIPDNLNRRFIIGELLETAEEMKNTSATPDMIIMQQDNSTTDLTLPDSYNETAIHSILRNPVLAFVWWDIKKTDIQKLRSEGVLATLKLHVSLSDDELSEQLQESFDVQITPADREQYVFLPSGHKFVRIDLISSSRSRTIQTLACSPTVKIPQENKYLQHLCPGCKIDAPPLLKLSGLEQMLRQHYSYHRQSFS